LNGSYLSAFASLRAFLKLRLRNRWLTNQPQSQKRQQSIHDNQFIIEHIIAKQQRRILADQKANRWR